MILLAFESRTELIIGYSGRLITLHDMDPSTAISLSEAMAIYVPDDYSGGWVIPTYGFSTERILDGDVEKETAGDPFLVRGLR